MKLDEKGVVHLLLLVILLSGIIAGVYLVTSDNILKIFSKAFDKTGTVFTNLGKEKKTEFVQGEVLVKLKTPLGKVKFKPGVQPLDIDKQEIPFSSVNVSSLPPVLATLNSKYKIKTIEKVFKGTQSSKQELSKFKSKFAQDLSQGKRKINEQKFLKNDLSRTHKLTFEKQDISIEEVVEELKKNPDVEYAELNYKGSVTATPNDPYFQYAWNLKKMQIEQAWNFSKGSSDITVAVLDTGVDYTHSDFPQNMTRGWNFVENNDFTLDYYGHGTKVAGLIGAVTNNARGISGIVWDSKILPVKVADNQGITIIEDVARGIVYATDNGARVINMSIRLYPSCSQTKVLQDAINYARALNSVLVVSAGNENADASQVVPASCDGVIVVAASGKSDEKTSYSNYGRIVDISVPSGGSCSYNLLDCYITTLAPGNQVVSTFSGTSAAAPQVSGIVALVLSVKPSLSADEVEQLLISTGDPTYSSLPIGKRLNAYKALLVVSPDPTSVPTPTPTNTPVPTSTPNPNLTSQSIPIGYGNNLIGLTIDKGPSYFAEDFLKELNTATSQSNKITKVYKTDPATNRNITHNLGTTTDNFPIKLGEGYFVVSNNWQGTITFSGDKPQISSMIIPKGDSLISFWTVPAATNKAETLLQAIKSQGIQVTQIARYQYGGYQGHPIGYPFNNFDIVPGEGYSIKNLGETKTYVFAVTPIDPSPAPFICTACAADINKDGWVNNLDFSKLSGCYLKDVTDDCVAADINKDGKVNAGDYACLTSQYNKKCEVAGSSTP